MSFEGKYKLTKTENFDKFLAELGMGLIKRKIANASTPELQISQDGDSWTIKTKAIKDSTITFKLGEEFDEVRQDDAKVKSTITQDGDTWTQVQKGEKDVTIVRQFTAEGVNVTATCNGVTSDRFYSRQ
ncbi:Fatty acid-binding protein [Halotydeus destructor]|nr:Fatty acid-binding protein [Halotydeus destructor]